MSARGESGASGDGVAPGAEPVDRPAAGEHYNPGTATKPRQAASVILLRDGTDDALELLLVKRTPKARFMGGVWVFPGGAVDADEGDGDDAHRAAAVRELREEAAISLDDPQALVKFSRWITPAQVQIRFDTHFFLARVPDEQRRRSTARSASSSAGSRPTRHCRHIATSRSRSSSRRSSISNS
ncbi:MAG TPA: NUDIX hydrolase [Solirubrobacteraceae bacterium]|nr:NUDIX hydrolase [Solirubrobacteraceae bacterium]